MFKLIPNFSLRHNNSFGLDVCASYWLSIDRLEDWSDAMTKYPHLLEEKKLIVGGGTNLLFLSDFDGLVLSPDFSGIEVTYQDDEMVELTVGAGIDFDELVAHCVAKEWYGIENLSLIPGKVGAVPVQNIGAYGVEVADVIVRVNGIHLESFQFASYEQNQCHFSYRSSLFKEKFLNEFLVTSVVFRLQKVGAVVTGYGDLNHILQEKGAPTLSNLRRAVIQIRQSKLPDPAVLGNAGSFFKNPVVAEEVANALVELLPGLPVYQLSDGYVKVGAGFLIDRAGWKGFQMGCAAVHDKQALVIVNKGGATGKEILDLAEAIQKDVLAKYGVLLEREVQVVA